MLNHRPLHQWGVTWGALLLCFGSLAGCEWGDEPAKPATIKPHKASVSAEGKGDLGFYTGAFNPTPEQVQVKKEFTAFVAKEEQEVPLDETYTNPEDFPAKFRPHLYKNPLYGTMGLSQPNHVSLVIDPFKDDHTVTGRSIAAGNDRALKGTWEKTAAGYHLRLSESGDDPRDGQFDLQLNRAQKIIQGQWSPYNTKLTPKSLALKQSQFQYNPQAGQDDLFIRQEPFEINPSTTALTTKDVENLTQPEIKIIRNLIYARHGYTFAALDLRQYFEAMAWYVPYKADITPDLTEVEKNNIALLKRYEDYAEKTYESFGR